MTIEEQEVMERGQQRLAEMGIANSRDGFDETGLPGARPSTAATPARTYFKVDSPGNVEVSDKPDGPFVPLEQPQRSPTGKRIRKDAGVPRKPKPAQEPLAKGTLTMNQASEIKRLTNVWVRASADSDAALNRAMGAEADLESYLDTLTGITAD